MKGCNFDLYSAPLVIVQLGVFSVPHFLWHGTSVLTSVYNGQLVTLNTYWRVFSSHAVTTFYRLRSVAAGIRTPNPPLAVRTFLSTAPAPRCFLFIGNPKCRQYIVDKSSGSVASTVKSIFFFSFFQIFGFTFLAEGIALAFDKVFNHKILKQTLFSSFAFDGLSFNSIRESFYLYLIIYGTILVIFCGLAFFTLGTKSKCFHVCVSTIANFYI